MLRVGLLALVVMSGCSVRRYLVLPSAAAVEGTAPLLGPEFSWSLGEVSSRVELLSGQGTATATALVDVDELKSQLKDRVRTTLEAQVNLGSVQARAPYSLEVDVTAQEKYGLGPQFGLAIGVEIAIAALGAGVGALIGGATSPAQPGQFSGGPLLGMSIGALASLPVAVGVALAFDSGEVRGEYEAVLTLRRRSDRVPVATRRVSSTWRAGYNGFNGERTAAVSAGAALPDFERALLQGVKGLLLEVSEPIAAAGRATPDEL